jgi:hypothetical protein
MSRASDPNRLAMLACGAGGVKAGAGFRPSLDPSIEILLQPTMRQIFTADPFNRVSPRLQRHQEQMPGIDKCVS